MRTVEAEANNQQSTINIHKNGVKDNNNDAMTMAAMVAKATAKGDGCNEGNINFNDDGNGGSGGCGDGSGIGNEGSEGDGGGDCGGEGEGGGVCCGGGSSGGSSGSDDDYANEGCGDVGGRLRQW
jgi:hypothetical protein